MITFKEATRECQGAWGPGRFSECGQLGVVSMTWGEDPDVVLSLIDDGLLRLDVYTGKTSPYMNPLSLSRHEWALEGPRCVPMAQAIHEATEWRKEFA